MSHYCFPRKITGGTFAPEAFVLDRWHLGAARINLGEDVPCIWLLNERYIRIQELACFELFEELLSRHGPDHRRDGPARTDL